MRFLSNGHIIKEEREFDHLKSKKNFWTPGEDQTDNTPSSRSDALMAEKLQETYGKQGEINALMSANWYIWYISASF